MKTLIFIFLAFCPLVTFSQITFSDLLDATAYGEKNKLIKHLIENGCTAINTEGGNGVFNNVFAYEYDDFREAASVWCKISDDEHPIILLQVAKTSLYNGLVSSIKYYCSYKETAPQFSLLINGYGIGYEVYHNLYSHSSGADFRVYSEDGSEYIMVSYSGN